MLLVPDMVVMDHKKVCTLETMDTLMYLLTDIVVTTSQCMRWMLPSLMPHTQTSQMLMPLTTYIHMLPTNHNGLFPVLPLSRSQYSILCLHCEPDPQAWKPKPMLILSSLMFMLLSLMLKALLWPPILDMLLLLRIVHIKTWRQTILIPKQGIRLHGYGYYLVSSIKFSDNEKPRVLSLLLNFYFQTDSVHWVTVT